MFHTSRASRYSSLVGLLFSSLPFPASPAGDLVTTLIVLLQDIGCPDRGSSTSPPSNLPATSPLHERRVDPRCEEFSFLWLALVVKKFLRRVRHNFLYVFFPRIFPYSLFGGGGWVTALFSRRPRQLNLNECSSRLPSCPPHLPPAEPTVPQAARQIFSGDTLGTA